MTEDHEHCPECGRVLGYCACDDETNNDLSPDEYLELEQEREDERRAECHCGAYQWSQKQGRYVQVADCIC